MPTTRPFVARDSPAAALDKVLEATSIARDTVLEGSTGGDVVLSPLRDKTRSERVAAISDGIFARHARAFGRLGE